MDTLLTLARPALVPAFTAWGSPVSWLEMAAFVLALWMVWANLRVQMVAWPLAIVSSLMYAVLFAHSRLYGEAALQFVFVALALWGWWQWRQGTSAHGQRLQVRAMTVRARWVAGGATLAAWPVLAGVLARTTDSDVPWLDALPTVGSITGQILLGRKLIENWPTWVAVNAISIGLFWHKGLWLTVVLYALFMLLALAGWRAWARLARAERA